MTSPVKLHYANAAGLAEPIRFMLHYSGIQFKDERFASFKDFLQIKDKFPFGQVPVLEIDGKIMHQTKSITRYLAKKSNLAGRNDLEAAECDIMADTVDDLRLAMAAYFYEKNHHAKSEKKESLFATTIPYYVGKFEKHLTDNGGHFVNGQLTWTDIYFAALVDYFNHMAGKDLFADQTALKSLRHKVIELKGIKEYMSTRPPAFPAKF